MKHSEVLTEATKAEIIRRFDDDFLKQRIRYMALQRVRYGGHLGNGFLFNVHSSEYKRNNIVYQNVIRFPKWSQIVFDPKLSTDEATEALLNSDVELHCPCPSFKFHGFKYILTQLKASIRKENRYPKITNPRLRGSACKHMRKVIEHLPTIRMIVNMVVGLERNKAGLPN